MCLDTLSLVNIGWVLPQGHHLKGACRAFWAVFARSWAENRHTRGKTDVNRRATHKKGTAFRARGYRADIKRAGLQGRFRGTNDCLIKILKKNIKKNIKKNTKSIERFKARKQGDKQTHKLL